MAIEKQHARLEEWFFLSGRLRGRVYDHPAFEDGDQVTTSPVLSAPDDIKEGGTITTRNTIYKLGEKHHLKKEQE